MAVLPIILLGVAASIAGVQGEEVTPLAYGMYNGNKAFGIVCWYEYLKVFPITNGKAFLKCSPGLKHLMKDTTDEAWFGKYVPKAMDYLPSEYTTNCQQYLDEPNAAPPADEKDAINDQGNDAYPYRAFAYCMMKTLRDKHGDKAIQAVKDEKTHTKKHWMQALLDRDNEFRARHGADPLILGGQLVEAAQAWADENAATCNMHHTEGSQRLFDGEGTGENIYSSGGDDQNDIAAYQASASWYEEVNNYPFPDVFNGHNALGNGVVGHFTQTVWKGSKYVGYGYAHGGDNCEKRFIVARYYPAGNNMNTHAENVGPAKD